MSEQVLIQFRADKALKQEVAEIYERLGMDLPTAFRMFMAKSKMVKGLPFEATLPEQTITMAEAKSAFYELRRQAGDVPEMSLDEINAEVFAVRNEKKGKLL
ncbi:MAG: RelB/DinJ family addiction module antitoxin [Lachnospiraceae bacterium]|nr:RelB/DinJ family addiction module antitoxin [Lachnospiraceae bacterium]